MELSRQKKSSKQGRTTKPKFKKHRFRGYYDIKSFMWLPFQLKSATEIG
jgi:hypothetical protein